MNHSYHPLLKIKLCAENSIIAFLIIKGHPKKFVLVCNQKYYFLLNVVHLKTSFLWFVTFLMEKFVFTAGCLLFKYWFLDTIVFCFYDVYCVCMFSVPRIVKVNYWIDGQSMAVKQCLLRLKFNLQTVKCLERKFTQCGAPH